jgi:S-formylglutathione hydrolase FrmB
VLSRRGFLIGGAAAIGAAAGALVSVEQGWLPGRIALAHALGQCDVDAPIPIVPADTLLTESFRSTYRDRPVSWVLGLPPDTASAGLPVAVVLHGRGGDANTAFDTLGLHGFLAEHVAAGGPPFALAAIDGGDRYWHPRADGDDPLGMVVHELLPRLLSEYGLHIDRIAVTGWSMGGYGALLLARESGRDTLGGCRVVAAAALSPALFPSYADSSEGAFDDSADFASWGNLLADPEVGSDVALMVSCGESDPFTEATRDYRDAVHPTPVGGITRGCHDAGYWRSQAADVIAFLGANLAT